MPHSIHEKNKATCNQIRNKNHTGETKHGTQPPKYPSNIPGGVQASAYQPLDPHCKASLVFILQVGCCVSLHPLGGAEHITTCFPSSCR